MSDTQPNEGAPAPAHTYAPPAESASAPPAAPEEWVRRPVGDFDPRYKSPRSAVFLSMIFPGLGQIYTGFYTRGLMIWGLMFGLFMTAANIRGNVIPIMVWTIIFTWMFSMIDAGRMSAMYNYAIAGGEEIAMPQDVKIPKMGGSIVIGAIFMVFGGIALSNTLFDIPLRWVESWWPVFPLAIGAYLLARGVMDHMNSQEQADNGSSDSGFSSDALEQE